MEFHTFISISSIVMAPDLKTRSRTDGRGNDSARAVVDRPFFVDPFSLKLSTAGFLLLQCSSCVVRHPRDLMVSVPTRCFCRVLIFVSS